jgi:predicted AlkP superfamily pyrophosphatase or phosphodiesterase
MKLAKSALVLIVTSAGFGAVSQEAAQEEPPRLIVLLSIDQLRGDLLDTYDAHFRYGFRRLRDEGFRFTQTSHFHSDTDTGPGHATLATGYHPARHGILANNWLEVVGGRYAAVYSAGDSLAPILGFPGNQGRSPVNLLVDGLPDWVGHADPNARVASISGKDRTAVTMGGRGKGDVYWFFARAGRFVTSTHYRDEYPDWLEGFESETLAEILKDTVWTSTVPAELEGLVRPDTSIHEGDGVYTAFPHYADVEADTFPGGYERWFEWTPFLDVATAAMTMKVAQELELGRRGSTDYLAIGLSATDRVGHKYGPKSLEQLDNLLRLDRILGELMDFLDDHVGESRWVLGLSSDHGAQTIPEHAAEEGDEAHRITLTEIAEIVSAVEEGFAAGSGPRDRADRIAAALDALPLIDRVFTTHELLEEEPADSFAVMFRNSTRLDRFTFTALEIDLRRPLFAALGVKPLFREGLMPSPYAEGSAHSFSPYWYNRHVPLVFMGAGVTPGYSDEPAHTVDMAPTLAALAGIPVPEDVDGRPLLP